jgi:hypothetical protein
MQQRTRLTVYKESATAATREIERLRHENAILHSGACPPSGQDYRRFTVALVTSSMDGTTPVCCSTSLTKRWRSVPMGLSTLSTMWRYRTPSLRSGWRRSPTLSSSSWSFRCRWHLSLLTLRRSMPCRVSMRTRSHRCRMQGDIIFEWIGLG